MMSRPSSSLRSSARVGKPTLQWSDSVDLALECMDYAACDELWVLDGEQVIGSIRRRDIHELMHHGGWLASILVRDAMHREQSTMPDARELSPAD
jgi:predicted transcriptional regulator